MSGAIGGPAPSTFRDVYPPAGERVSPGDFVNASASGETAQATEDTLDGKLCGKLSDVMIVNPLATFPMPPAANYSRIGARPYDLGAMMLGGTSIPTPGYDDGAALQAQALLSTPLTHPLGYGASFALGSEGTVAPSSGAFLHPFTLLSLPSYAPRMGVLLQIEYLSNAMHPTADPKPFGEGFVLSGYDFLVETSGASPTAGATNVSIFRGDGLEARYQRTGGSNPWTYSGPIGAQDALTASYDNNALTYTRWLRDGRAITYVRADTSHNFVRSSVVDGYGNTISYTWLSSGGVARLQTITDTRQMVVHVQWDQGSPQRVEQIYIQTTNASIDAPQADGTPVTQEDLTIHFAYDAARQLQRIQWFPTKVIADANADGRLATTEVALLRPTVELKYESHGKLGKVWDKTIPTAPILQLDVEYAADPDWGVRVVTEVEAGNSTHLFAYPGATSRIYTDPRGRIAELTLETSEYRVTTVKMKPGTLTPRIGDGYSGEHGDHTELTWQVFYDCCSLPVTIVEPSQRTFTFVWSNNAVQQVKVGTKNLHRFDLDGVGRVRGWWPGDDQAPAALTVAYTDLQGKVAPTSITLQTRDYRDPRTHSSVGPSATTLTFDPTTGRLTGTTHPAGGSSTFTYAPSDPGRNLLGKFLESITGPAAGPSLKLAYVCDDLGRPSSMKRGLPGGERETKLYVDSLFRVRKVAAKAFATGLELASEAWQDRFGADALLRRENREPDDTARARPWLQSEMLRDAQGRVVRTVNDGAPVTDTSEVALVTQMTWYDDNRVETVTGPRGGVTTYVWDGYGLLYKTVVQTTATTTVEPRRLFYNQDAQVVFVQDGMGHELRIVRVPMTGLISQVYDPAGLHRLDFSYDPSLRLERIGVWAPAAEPSVEVRTTVLTYDELDRVEMVSMGPPGTVDSRRIHVFDLGGRLVEIGLQQNRDDTMYLRGLVRQFDEYGRLQWQRDRLSDTADQWNKVSFTYDPYSGLPSKLTEYEIEQAVGQFGMLTGTGHTAHLYETLLTHDLLDRVTKVEQLPEVGQTGSSVLHQYHYDSLGDLVRFQDALSAELLWCFDALGNLRKRTEKGTQGHDIVTTTAINFVTGDVTRTDSEARVSRFYHDLAWRLTRQEFPGYVPGNTSLTPEQPAFRHTFGYDAASRLTSIWNGNDVQILRSYDDSGRLREQWAVPPLNGHSEWATKEVLDYDVFGGLSELTTKAGTTYASHVVKVTQTQDEYGRTLSETFDFWDDQPTGPPVLNVTSTYGSGGTEDLLVRHGLTVDGVGAMSFQLDRLGRTWGYGDGNGAADQYIARYRFVGGRVRERQQGRQATQAWLLSTENGWDPLRRLSSLQTTAIATSTVLSRFDHTFDREGHILTRKRDRVGVAAGGGDMFQLDEYYRLAGVKLGVHPSQFGGTYDGATGFQREIEYSPDSAPLDEAQNRHLVKETVGSTTTSTVYSLDPSSHRYQSVGGMLMTYDGEGNLLSDGLRFFVYDFKNRLSEVWVYAPADGEQPILSASASRDGRAHYAVPIERLQRIRARARNTLLSLDRIQRGFADVSGRAALANQDPGLAAVEGNLELLAFYGYDPFNRRVIRALAGQPVRYSTWDGWREVAEHVWIGSWFTYQSYVWGTRIDELIRFSRNLGNGWQHFHPQQDHQDSVDLLVDANGVPKEKYEYDPFGGVTVFTWNGSAWTNPSPVSPLGNPYTYTGRRLDGETGLMYYRNRYYWPAVGRFLTGDPVGLWWDPYGVGNGLSFAYASPATYGDPYGLQPPPRAQRAGAALAAGQLGAASSIAFHAGTTTIGAMLSQAAATMGALAASAAPPVAGAVATVGAGVVATGVVRVAQHGVFLPLSPLFFDYDDVLLTDPNDAAVGGDASDVQPEDPQPKAGGAGNRKGGRKDNGPPNKTCWRRATSAEIHLIEKMLGEDIHAIKKGLNNPNGDIFINDRGDAVLKPRDGSGPGEPLNVNIRVSSVPLSASTRGNLLYSTAIVGMRTTLVC